MSTLTEIRRQIQVQVQHPGRMGEQAPKVLTSPGRTGLHGRASTEGADQPRTHRAAHGRMGEQAPKVLTSPPLVHLHIESIFNGLCVYARTIQ